MKSWLEHWKGLLVYAALELGLAGLVVQTAYGTFRPLRLIAIIMVMQFVSACRGAYLIDIKSQG